MLSFILILTAVALGNAEPAQPLPPETAGNATRYMEWLLDVSFSAADRQQYGRILEETFRGNNEGAKNAVIAMAGAYEKLSTMSEAERTGKREKAQAEFVRLLRSASDADSNWLLSRYDAAHAQTGSNGLVGRWSTGHISSIQYRNTYTGVSAPTNGNSFAWEFHADGTYSFTGLMQSVMYNCTTTMFSNETGSYTIEGQAVSLKPEKNPYKMTNNCAPSSNREAPGKLIQRSYQFRIKQDSAGYKLDLVGADGAVQTFSQSR